MRDYAHDPDREFAEREYRWNRDGVDDMRANLSTPGFVDDPRWVGQLVQTSGLALGFGWALGRPVEELREVVAPGLTGLHAGLDAGIEPDAVALTYPLRVSIIAGDRAGARRVASIRRGLAPEGAPNDTADHVATALAALALDDPGAARTHATTVSAHLDRLETPPEVVDAVAGLDRMAIAIVDDDQDGLDAAAEDRASSRAQLHGGTAEGRRDVLGVFDFDGVALCRFAHVAGLDLPDQPIFAAELVRDL